MGQKGPKLIYLIVHYGNIFSQDWLIRFVSCFAWSWAAIKVLKTGGAKFFEKFFGENSCLSESRSKWLYLCIHPLQQHFFQDWLIGYFWYFAWSWGTISTQYWRSRIFLKNSYLCENRPKMVRFICSSIMAFCHIFVACQNLLIRFVTCFALSWLAH